MTGLDLFKANASATRTEKGNRETISPTSALARSAVEDGSEPSRWPPKQIGEVDMFEGDGYPHYRVT